MVAVEPQSKLVYCYIWRDPKNGIPRYVGKGTADRAWAHVKYPNETHCSRMLCKRIVEGFKIEPEIIHCKDDDQAFSLEMWFIWKYGREDLGLGTLFNQTDGGDGLTNPSSESRMKMSISGSKARLGKKHSAARNKAKSNRMKGKPNLSGVKLQKKCTVDGVHIYPSVGEFVKALGNGKSGIKHPNFRFIEE